MGEGANARGQGTCARDGCAEPLTKPPRGPDATYCSDACRARAYREKREREVEDLRHQLQEALDHGRPRERDLEAAIAKIRDLLNGPGFEQLLEMPELPEAAYRTLRELRGFVNGVASRRP